MKRIVLAACTLCALMIPAGVQAEPAQEFSFQLTDVRPDGGFTVVYTSRNYDTTGVVPPSPNEFNIRLPAGAKLRKQFRAKRFFCDTRKLNSTRDPKSCRRSLIGTGRVQVDARPFFTELIPANLWLFLAKGTRKAAVASMAILGKADPSAPIVKSNPIIAEYKAPVAFLDFFDDPTPDGRFGYRLAFGGEGGGGAGFSIAETRLVTRGLTTSSTGIRCDKRSRGRCVRRRSSKKRLFWFTPPSCPPSGRVSFQAFFGYASFPDITKVTELSCPAFGAATMMPSSLGWRYPALRLASLRRDTRPTPHPSAPSSKQKSINTASDAPPQSQPGTPKSRSR